MQEQRSLLRQHCFLIVDLLELAYVMRTPPHAKVNSRVNSAPSMAYQTNNLMTGKNKSKFEYARQVILKAFTKKWYPQESKLAYITTFRPWHWRRKHGCTGCWCTHEISEWNTHFALKCYYVTDLVYT